MTVLHALVPIEVHIEIANASSKSNHPKEIEALHVPNQNTASTPIVGSCTKKLIVTRDDNLRLRSESP